MGGACNRENVHSQGSFGLHGLGMYDFSWFRVEGSLTRAILITCPMAYPSGGFLSKGRRTPWLRMPMDHPQKELKFVS